MVRVLPDKEYDAIVMKKKMASALGNEKPGKDS
jgi:hypothetical protein